MTSPCHPLTPLSTQTLPDLPVLIRYLSQLVQHTPPAACPTRDVHAANAARAARAARATRATRAAREREGAG